MADVKVQTREDRLKAALRENLRRRKAQARGRTASDGAPEPSGQGGAQESPPGEQEAAAEGAPGPKAPTD